MCFSVHYKSLSLLGFDADVWREGEAPGIDPGTTHQSCAAGRWHAGEESWEPSDLGLTATKKPAWTQGSLHFSPVTFFLEERQPFSLSFFLYIWWLIFQLMVPNRVNGLWKQETLQSFWAVDSSCWLNYSRHFTISWYSVTFIRYSQPYVCW